MLTFFYVCFGVGVGYTIISFLLGQALDFADFDMDMDTGIVSPFKPVVIASFITVFGGVGIITVNYGFSTGLCLFLAADAGAVAAFIIYQFIIKPLSRAQNTSAPAQEELIGLHARVTLRIPENQYGKIAYVIHQNTFSSPAKSLDGVEIETGRDVVISEIKDNTFYVLERLPKTSRL